MRKIPIMGFGGYRKLTEYEQVLTISVQNRVSGGYQKYWKGIRNVQRVSEILGGYRKCKKGNGKLKN